MKIRNYGVNFAIGEMEVGHGGIGAHGARIRQPVAQGLFAFAFDGVVEVGGFERAAPADDVTTAAAAPLDQRRADCGGDFDALGQVQVPARAEQGDEQEEKKEQDEEGEKGFAHRVIS